MITGHFRLIATMTKTLKVLFVEDSEDDVELTIVELARGGYKTIVHRVETAESMRQALSQEDWDVVISDFHMPQFSAEKALSTLQESGKDYPFIIQSGVVDAEDAVTLLKRGAHDFLNKEAPARLVPAIERELREAEDRKKRSEAEERVRILSQAVEQSPVSVVITNREGIINYVNPRFEEVTGYTTKEAVGRSLDFTMLEQPNGHLFNELWQAAKTGHEWRGEFCNRHKDGQMFWEYANISPLKDDRGNITHFIAVKEDITVRRSYEEQLRKQAHYDDLTGLANRVLMLARLDTVVSTAMRNNTKAALVCLDLDRFKNVNDTRGHIVGDKLLREAAGRLGGCVRSCDTLARMGGDEFVIILPEIGDESVVQRVAERVVEVFETSFNIEHIEHFITASIGIAILPEDGTSQQELLQNADLAMYKAKEFSGNHYQFFTEEINRHMQQRQHMELNLRKAISQNELFLCYQPVVDAQSNQPVTFEALIRWQPTDGPMYRPDQFIPLAEDVGLISEIGKWVLAQACATLPELQKRVSESVQVAVNVSPKQLQEKGFSDYVAQQIMLNGMHPSQLELEITESVLVDDTPETHTNLAAISNLGVSLSIDDFGTGYSALGYLQKYPFKTLKIDRSFVNKLTSNDKDNNARLVETIITMAHGLSLEVIAEGVETHQQLNFLRNCQCDKIQGFLISKPLPIDELPSQFNIGSDYIEQSEKLLSIVK